MSATVDVGRNVIASRQIKMAASLTRDIKCEVVKLLFDSAAEIAEEMSINRVAIHLSVAAEWQQF